MGSIGECAPPSTFKESLIEQRLVRPHHEHGAPGMPDRLLGHAPEAQVLKIGYCSLGLATSLPLVAFAVICIGLGNGILMPTILTWIAAVTPKQFLGRASGGFLVALNTGQFASTLAIVPVIAITGTYGNLFLAFGCIALLLTLPYALATVRVRNEATLPQTIKVEN
jgi:MFS family permease